MSNLQDPASLDAARREWLAGLARAHANAPSIGSALAYGQGAWKCGEYDVAMGQFQWAHAVEPDSAETTLSLLRGASMLARFDIEEATLATASARNVETPLLALHRALKHVPASVSHARSLLAAHRADALCAQFDAALAAIESGSDLPLPQDQDPRELARDDSLRWALRNSCSPDVHVGLPIDVLLRALDAAPSSGLTVECGVYFGRSLRVIAARTRGAVHGFDSFRGLPEAWNAAEGAGAYSTAGRLPMMPANVMLHPGWFEESLAPFFAAHAGPIRLLHIDCDLYSSTRTVLEHSRPRLVPGSVLVFDDLLGYPGFEAHELRAWDEFTAACGVEWELLATCLLGREVAMRIVSIAN